MKWEILVLMAGEGSRFKTAGYQVPKPLIETRGKTILEWTTSSLPFIKHRGISKQELEYRITFAIRTEHNKNNQLVSYLNEVYGSETNIVMFDSLTRGNLETALFSSEDFNPESPLLILDADNKYDGSDFLRFILEKPTGDLASLCCFKPLDDSEKWCFAKVKNNKVSKLSEKKKIEQGYPMVGVFYFNKTQMFLAVAHEIINSNEKTRGEFYMSQSVVKLLEQKTPVYAFITKQVNPLGTPEDLERFEHENLL